MIKTKTPIGTPNSVFEEFKIKDYHQHRIKIQTIIINCTTFQSNRTIYQQLQEYRCPELQFYFTQMPLQLNITNYFISTLQLKNILKLKTETPHLQFIG